MIVALAIQWIPLYIKIICSTFSPIQWILSHEVLYDVWSHIFHLIKDLLTENNIWVIINLFSIGVVADKDEGTLYKSDGCSLIDNDKIRKEVITGYHFNKLYKLNIQPVGTS